MLSCYYMDISGDCPYDYLEDLCKILPEERRKRAERFRNEEIARKYLLSSVFMQYGLSRTLNVSIGKIAYAYGKYGKPEILYSGDKLEGKIDFNLSHSGKFAVLAVSDRPVGIDVECLKKNRMLVAERFFCREEYEDIFKAEGAERDIRFLEYWTMKEAYVKRMGCGLHFPLNGFLIRRAEKGVSFVEQENIYFNSFFLEDGTYCVSVCSEYKDELQGASINSIKEIKLEQIICVDEGGAAEE